MSGDALQIAPPAALARPADFATCRAWIVRHSRSFYLSSRLLPREVREASWALYAFCRRADDAVDEGEAAGGARRVAALRQRLAAVYGGEAARAGSAPAIAGGQQALKAPRWGEAQAAPPLEGGREGPPLLDPIDRAFSQVAARAGIPHALPARLLAGMEMDLAGTAYQTLPDLLRYCFNVASTVGLMMTAVMGQRVPGDRRAEVLLRASDLGVAMQLTNIARDVGEDGRRGRVYLPEELLLAHGTSRQEILDLSHRSAPPGPGLRQAVAALLAVARAHYAAADAGIPLLPPGCHLAIRAARKIYAAIGDRVAARGYDSITGRAVVSLFGKLGRVLSALLHPSPLLPAPRRPSVGPADALLLPWIREVGLLP